MSRVVKGIAVKEAHSYGVHLWLEDGRELSIRDMDPSLTVAEAFVARLYGEMVDAEQLHYLAEDHLHSRYDGTTP